MNKIVLVGEGWAGAFHSFGLGVPRSTVNYR